MANMCGKVAWLYQARRVNSQTAGGGGALTVGFSIPAGMTARIVSYYAAGPASAGATLSIVLEDEDGATQANYGYAVAGANNNLQIPSVGANAIATGNLQNSVGVILGPGMRLRASASAALNTETLTIGVALLLSAATAPTWDTTGSAGTPSLAASTISAANTLQVVTI